MFKIFKLILVALSISSVGCFGMQPGPHRLSKDNAQFECGKRETQVDLPACAAATACATTSIDQKLDQLGLLLKSQSEEQSQMVMQLSSLENSLKKMNQNLKTIKKVAIAALIISAIPIAITIAGKVAKH